jgi:hypothetical protein
MLPEGLRGHRTRRMMVSEKPPKERERKVWRRMWACARGREGRTGKFRMPAPRSLHREAGCGKSAGMAKSDHQLRTRWGIAEATHQQRRPPQCIGRSEVRTSVDEQSREFGLPLSAAHVERCLIMATTSLVHIGASADQQIHALRIPLHDS